MYNLILQILVFTSLGLVIYLLARAVPRVEDAPAPVRGPNFFDKLMAKIPMAKIDGAINSSLAKFLRKIKVLILKIDNFANDRLGKLTKKSGDSDKSSNNDQKLL